MKKLILKNKSIFDLNTEALVNPVNCVGIMGAGLALQFKNRFPGVFAMYAEDCRNKIYYPGGVGTVKDKGKVIYNIATKDHWKDKSKLEWVELGIKNLVDCLLKDGVKSIAIPAIGCGLGGLKANDVVPIIEKEIQKLNNLDITVYIVLP